MFALRCHAEARLERVPNSHPMSLHIQQPKLECGSFYVRGGWSAVVPEALQWDSDTLRAHSAYWLSDCRGDAWAARGRAAQNLQSAFSKWWIQELRKALKRWARVYAERWPEAIAPDGELRGFDAMIAQGLFMPGAEQNRVGRRGLKFAEEMLEKMAKGEGLC